MNGNNENRSEFQSELTQDTNMRILERVKWKYLPWNLKLSSKFTGRWFAIFILSFSSQIFGQQMFQQGSYNQVVVFGDSLSDTGNFAAVEGDFPVPYFGNRITNGFVAVEILANFIGVPMQSSLHLVGPSQGTNYAVASARSGTDRAIDLTSQVQVFLSNQGGTASADNLYVIFIGGNDIRKARYVSPSEAAVMVQNAVSGIIANMAVLIEAGATTFMVANSPDVGAIPESSLIATQVDNMELPAYATALTLQFNQALYVSLKGLRELNVESNLNLVEFDAFSYVKKFIDNPKSYQLSNVEDACFSARDFTFNSACEDGANFDDFFFFDEFHPSARMHERLARGMYGVVPDRLEE